MIIRTPAARARRSRLAALLVAAVAIGVFTATAASPAEAGEMPARKDGPADPGVAAVDFAAGAELPRLDKWTVVVPEGTGIDPSTGRSTAWVDGINEHGEMFGASGFEYAGQGPSFGQRATRWNADGTLADVWGVGTTAKGMNDAGTMVGTTVNGDERPHAVVWKDGTQILLPDDGATESVANDISNNDVVSGYLRHGDLTIAVVWYLATGQPELHYVPLPPETSWSNAVRVNDANLVLLTTSYTLDASGVTTPGAWLWWVGSEEVTPIPGATAAGDLNNANYATVDLFTGSAANPRDGLFHSSDAVPRPIRGIDGLTSTAASALNDVNDVVGVMFDCTFCGGSTPVLWEREFGGSPVPHRLQPLLREVPGYQAKNLYAALDINGHRSVLVTLGSSYISWERESVVMVPDEQPAQLDDARLESIDYPSGDWQDMPSRGVVQGTRSRLAFEVQNPDSQGDHIVSVELRNADTGQRMPDGYWFESLRPFDEAEGSIEFDTAGLAFDSSGEARPPLNLEVVVKGDGKEVERIPVSVPISPDPVVLVHGFNSSAAAWANYDSYLRSVHPGWLSFAVGDGQAPGVMNTGSLAAPDTPGYTIAQNAAIEAEYIEWVRDRTNAPHIDIVAHSMGGLISRAYIHDWMPMADDGKPFVNRLIMLGTPNAGSPCAAIMNLAGMRELRPDVLVDFNDRVTNRKGVEMSILVGTYVPRTCQSPERGDGVVPISSTMENSWDDAARYFVLHTSMTDRANFDFFVWPELVGGGPRGLAAPGGARFVPYEPVVDAPAEPSAGAELPPLLLSRTITVPAGEDIDIPFDADSASRIGLAAVADNGIRLELVDPSGTVVAAGNGGDPMTTLSSSEDPAEGTWRVRVSNAAETDRPAALAVYLNDAATTLEATIEVDAYGTARVEANFEQAGSPVKDATVSVRFAGTGDFVRSLVLREQPDGSYRAASQVLPEGPYRVVVTAEADRTPRTLLQDLVVQPHERTDNDKPTVQLEVPAPDGIDATGAGWYGDGVDGTIHATDSGSGVSFVSYEMHGATEHAAETTESSLPFSATAEGLTELWWFARDHAGNFRRPNAPVDILVDASAPTVAIEGVDGAAVEQGAELIARYTCADAFSGIAECVGDIPDGAALPTAVPGQHTLTVRGRDIVGHETTQTATYTVAGEVPDDTTPPVLTATLPPSTPGGWHPGPVDLTLAATDTASVVRSISWQINDGYTQTVTRANAEVTLEANGVTKVTSWATDAVGNISVPVVTTVRIDRDPPLVEVTSPEEDQRLSVGEEMRLDFTAADLQSGVATLTASVTSPDDMVSPLEPGDTIPSAVPGAHILTMTAADAAGHETVVERHYTVLAPAPDTTAPTAAASAPDGWSSSPVTVQVTGNDDSGVATIHWRLTGASRDQQSRQGTSAEFTVGTPGVTHVEYWAVDVAGNASIPHHLDVRVDPDSPVIHVDGIIDGRTYRADELGNASFSCEDPLSAIASCTGSTPAGEALPTSEGGHALVIEAVDHAGNTATSTVHYQVRDADSAPTDPDAGAGSAGAGSDPGRLPSTGGDSPIAVTLIASVLVLTGLMLLSSSRRRRRG
ncbi:LPXTG-motif cell wall-anchored protein [Microbacterium trichothecenolyticum]|uniref:alpha/beta fold hydrolase n=1 Tax=Microbacterium trichothecenolyticum TaxID=69370 RepID=UPI0028561DE6|nr:alpha/beta fold hydrolase [Microbacterium trichothecenolyticum]MDR7186830.1 LPXTG-motif cell wall-anchored protein [Microbacterium trichothecenolyticum]